MNQQNSNSLLNKSSFWQILAILLFTVSFLSLLILFLNPLSAQAEQLKTLSANVKSELQANYSVDAQRGFVPQIKLALVREIMTDKVSEAEVEPQYQAFINNLEIPVPTVTPDPLFVLVNSDTLEPTSSLALTLTTSPTLTVTVTETETENVTPTPTESATPWIVTLTWTPWPTNPPIGPTQTKVPVIQPTSTLTPTPVTPAPTLTFTLAPTLEPTTAAPPTSVPPSVTPTVTHVTPIVPADPPPVGSTEQPTATPTDEPRGRPTKVPKDTKTPKPDKDKSEAPLILRVPMLSEPVIIEWSNSQE